MLREEIIFAASDLCSGGDTNMNALQLPLGTASRDVAPNVTPHYYFNFGVYLQVIGERRSTRAEERVLHFDINSCVLKLFCKEKLKLTIKLDAIHRLIFDESQPRTVVIACCDDQRFLLDFQNSEDNNVFRTAYTAVVDNDFDINMYDRTQLMKGRVSKRGGSTFMEKDKYLILVPRKLLVLSSKTSAYPRAVMSLLDAKPRFDPDRGTLHLQIAGREHVFRAGSKQESLAWFRALNRACGMTPLPLEVSGGVLQAPRGPVRVLNLPLPPPQQQRQLQVMSDAAPLCSSLTHAPLQAWSQELQAQLPLPLPSLPQQQQAAEYSGCGGGGEPGYEAGIGDPNPDSAWLEADSLRTGYGRCGGEGSARAFGANPRAFSALSAATATTTATARPAGGILLPGLPTEAAAAPATHPATLDAAQQFWQPLAGTNSAVQSANSAAAAAVATAAAAAGLYGNDSGGGVAGVDGGGGGMGLPAPLPHFRSPSTSPGRGVRVGSLPGPQPLRGGLRARGGRSNSLPVGPVQAPVPPVPYQSQQYQLQQQQPFVDMPYRFEVRQGFEEVDQTQIADAPPSETALRDYNSSPWITDIAAGGDRVIFAGGGGGPAQTATAVHPPTTPAAQPTARFAPHPFCHYSGDGNGGGLYDIEDDSVAGSQSVPPNRRHGAVATAPPHGDVSGGGLVTRQLSTTPSRAPRILPLPTVYETEGGGRAGSDAAPPASMGKVAAAGMAGGGIGRFGARPAWPAPQRPPGASCQAGAAVAGNVEPPRQRLNSAPAASMATAAAAAAEEAQQPLQPDLEAYALLTGIKARLRSLSSDTLAPPPPPPAALMPPPPAYGGCVAMHAALAPILSPSAGGQSGDPGGAYIPAPYKIHSHLPHHPHYHNAAPGAGTGSSPRGGMAHPGGHRTRNDDNRSKLAAHYPHNPLGVAICGGVGAGFGGGGGGFGVGSGGSGGGQAASRVRNEVDDTSCLRPSVVRSHTRYLRHRTGGAPQHRSSSSKAPVAAPSCPYTSYRRRADDEVLLAHRRTLQLLQWTHAHYEALSRDPRDPEPLVVLLAEEDHSHGSGGEGGSKEGWCEGWCRLKHGCGGGGGAAAQALYGRVAAAHRAWLKARAAETPRSCWGSTPPRQLQHIGGGRASYSRSRHRRGHLLSGGHGDTGGMCGINEGSPDDASEEHWGEPGAIKYDAYDGHGPRAMSTPPSEGKDYSKESANGDECDRHADSRGRGEGAVHGWREQPPPPPPSGSSRHVAGRLQQERSPPHPCDTLVRGANNAAATASRSGSGGGNGSATTFKRGGVSAAVASAYAGGGIGIGRGRLSAAARSHDREPYYCTTPFGGGAQSDSSECGWDATSMCTETTTEATTDTLRGAQAAAMAALPPPSSPRTARSSGGHASTYSPSSCSRLGAAGPGRRPQPRSHPSQSPQLRRHPQQWKGTRQADDKQRGDGGGAGGDCDGISLSDLPSTRDRDRSEPHRGPQRWSSAAVAPPRSCLGSSSGSAAAGASAAQLLPGRDPKRGELGLHQHDSFDFDVPTAAAAPLPCSVRTTSPPPAVTIDAAPASENANALTQLHAILQDHLYGRHAGGGCGVGSPTTAASGCGGDAPMALCGEAYRRIHNPLFRPSPQPSDSGSGSDSEISEVGETVQQYGGLVRGDYAAWSQASKPAAQRHQQQLQRQAFSAPRPVLDGAAAFLRALLLQAGTGLQLPPEHATEAAAAATVMSSSLAPAPTPGSRRPSISPMTPRSSRCIRHAAAIAADTATNAVSEAMSALSHIGLQTTHITTAATSISTQLPAASAGAVSGVRRGALQCHQQHVSGFDDGSSDKEGEGERGSSKGNDGRRGGGGGGGQGGARSGGGGGAPGDGGSGGGDMDVTSPIANSAQAGGSLQSQLQHIRSCEVGCDELLLLRAVRAQPGGLQGLIAALQQQQQQRQGDQQSRHQQPLATCTSSPSHPARQQQQQQQQQVRLRQLQHNAAYGY